MGALHIIRGLPGSGKSTLAKHFATTIPNSAHVEADMYFETKHGYKFDPSLLADAHLWCYNKCCDFLKEGKMFLFLTLSLESGNIRNTLTLLT